MLAKRLIKSNDAGGGGACTNTVDLYNPFPDGGGVALYQLNGDATDESGNYDGTATDVTYGAGQFGQAGVFNGSSSKIDLGNTAPFGESDIIKSISCWTKLATTSNRNFIYSVSGTADPINWFIIYYGGDTNDITVYRRSGSTSNTAFTAATITPDTNWHHVVVQLTATEVEIYLDGNKLTTTNTNTGTGTNTSWITYPAYSGTIKSFVGISRQNTPEYTNGSNDQLRFFSRALRPYEVEALYTEEYCTPTIVPSEHFNTVLYTGNGSTQSVTGVGFEPDFVWIKDRFVAEWHGLMDSVRGSSQVLYSNATNQEASTSDVTSFNSDGFSLTNNNNFTNRNGDSYVAWNWKAGGAAVTNTDGTITSQVSANTEAGFSVVSWTGSGAANATVGHGLNNTPSLYITKRRNSTGNWVLFATTLLPTANAQEYLVLNNTDASGGASQALPTSNILNVESVFDNISSATYIAYCFAEVEGFSNFGSYAGTGSSVTQSIVTGFEPAFVIIKDYSAGGSWWIEDNKRGAEKSLKANSSDAESTTNYVEFLENGFTVTSGLNDNSAGSKFIYMAFAADPTTIEPSLEDSFNTVTWTGDSVQGRSISGVGFAPDFTWIKKRTGVSYNSLFDTVRGAGNKLVSNETLAEYGNTYGGVSVFESDGFAVNSLGVTNLGDVNLSPNTYVAWNWKAAEIPAINSNGSIPSVVSANPAAGFSIVSYTGNGANATIGHGLGIAPNVILFKDRTIARNWRVYHSAIGAGQNLKLNTTDAASSDAAIFQSTTPTENVFYVGASGDVNANTDNFIAYCFAEVAGFSKFGSYTGTGSAGNFQDCGFEPAFVMLKGSSFGTNWNIFDNKRGASKVLNSNLSQAEGTYPPDNTYVISENGFSFTGYYGNDSGQTFIYMAFANQF
jgi:hypothetical protein